MQLSTPPLSVDVLRPATLPARPGEAPADRIRKTAEDFEASFLAALLQPVFASLPTDGPFGGGEGEASYRSFMVEAMARQAVKAGGVGLAARVQAEMLKMQEGGAR